MPKVHKAYDWNVASLAVGCKNAWGVTPRPSFLPEAFGFPVPEGGDEGIWADPGTSSGLSAADSSSGTSSNSSSSSSGTLRNAMIELTQFAQRRGALSHSLRSRQWDAWASISEENLVFCTKL